MRTNQIANRPETTATIVAATCRDVALGLALWYGITRLLTLAGLPVGESASRYVACGVILMILPSAWICSRKLKTARAPSA